MIYIGIDTGTHTGVAVWNSRATEFVALETLPIHRALELVRKEAEANEVLVVFEDARQRKWIPMEKSFSQMKGRAMGAGSVKRDATIWEDFCKDYGIDYRAVPPQAGATKWSADQFAKVTGWKGRTSNHARDAALLVFGK